MPATYSNTHFFSVPDLERNYLSIISVGQFSAIAPFLCDRPKGWKQPELVCISKGKGFVKVGAEEWLLERGSVILLPHDQAYKFGVLETGGILEGRWLSYAGDYLFGLWHILGLTGVHHIPNAESIFLLLEEIFQISNSQKDHGAHECTALLYRFLTELEKVNKKSLYPYAPPKDSIVIAQEYAKKNLHKNIGLNDLARIAKKSPFHFARSFKERTGFSPITFLRTLRLNLAKELLIQSTYNINEVGQRVGYPSPQHFSQVFKQEVGLSPRSYVKRYRNK